MSFLVRCLLLLVPALSFAQTTPVIQGLEHTEGNRITHLPEGRALNDARMELLKSAKSSIYLSAFSYSYDEVGKSVYNVLCEKAKQGLDVRVIIDHHNNINLLEHTTFLKEKCGAFVISFRPGNRWFALHEKILLVDGEKAINGGSGYSKKYLHAAPDSYQPESELRKIRTEGWYDSDYLLEGPGACSLHRQFRNHFIILARQMADYNPDIRWYGVENFWQMLPKYYGFGKFKNCDSKTVMGDERAILIHNNPHKTKSSHRPILAAHVGAIDQTVKGDKVLLYGPYFVPGKKFVNALILALKRGVEVKVITNSVESNDEKKHGKKIFVGMIEAITPMIKAGASIYLWNQKGTIHRKGGKIGKVAFYGSDNLDNRGQDYQAEVVVYTDSSKVVSQVEFDFERDLELSKPLTYEYTKKVYKDSSWLDKFVAKRLRRYL